MMMRRRHQHDRKNYVLRHAAAQQGHFSSGFKMWKKGKTWLYAGAIFFLLAGSFSNLLAPTLSLYGYGIASAATSASPGLTGTAATVQAGSHQPGASFNQGFGGYTSTGSIAGTTATPNQSAWQLSYKTNNGTSWASSTATNISANLCSNTGQEQNGYLTNNLILDTTKSFSMTMDYTMTGNPYYPGAVLGLGATYDAYGSGIGLYFLPVGGSPAVIEGSSNGIDNVVSGAANAGGVFAGLDFYFDNGNNANRDPVSMSVSQTQAMGKITQSDSTGALPNMQTQSVTPIGTNPWQNSWNFTTGSSTGQTTSVWSNISVTWTPTSGSTGTMVMTDPSAQSGLQTVTFTNLTLPSAVQFGYAASHGSNQYYYTQMNVTPKSFSGTSATQAIGVNYISSTTGKAIAQADTIVADDKSLIGVVSTTSNYNAADAYDYLAPTIAGYSLSNIAGSGGLSNSSGANSGTLQVNPSGGNQFNLTYVPNTQYAGFYYSFAAGSTGNLPAPVMETGATDSPIATPNLSIPAGYTASYMAPNGQIYSSLTAAIASQTGVAGAAGTYGPTSNGTGSPSSYLAGTNDFEIILTPMSVTASFNYAFASNTPGTGSNPGVILPFGSPATTSLPAATTETGNFGTTIAPPSSTPNLPQWSSPVASTANTFASKLTTNLGWQQSNPVTGAPLGTYSGTPYETAVQTQGTTALKTDSTSGQTFDSSGNPTAVSMAAGPLSYLLANPATNTYLSTGNSFDTTVIANITPVFWTVLAVDSSGNPLTSDANFGTSGSKGYYAGQGNNAGTATAGSPLANNTASEISSLSLTPADLTNLNGPNYYLTGGYSYTDDSSNNVLTHYDSWAALIAAHPNVSQSDPVIAMEVALDQTALASKASDQIVPNSSYTPSSDLTNGLDRDGTNADNNFDTVNGDVQAQITDSSGNIVYTGLASGTVSNLAVGNYSVKYTALNGNGSYNYQNWLTSNSSGTIAQYLASLSPAEVAAETLSTTTSLTVADLTAIQTNASNSFPKTASYSPANDLLSTADVTGTDGDNDKNTANGYGVYVTISDSAGNSVWMGTSTDTIAAGTLAPGSYNETYRVLNSTGLTAYQTWLTSNSGGSVETWLSGLTTAELAADTLSSTTILSITNFSLPFAGGEGFDKLLLFSASLGVLGLLIRLRRRKGGFI